MATLFNLYLVADWYRIDYPHIFIRQVCLRCNEIWLRFICFFFFYFLIYYFFFGWLLFCCHIYCILSFVLLFCKHFRDSLVLSLSLSTLYISFSKYECTSNLYKVVVISRFYLWIHWVSELFVVVVLVVVHLVNTLRKTNTLVVFTLSIRRIKNTNKTIINF